ncbi:hypothetical protein FQN60_007418, partial [Etheostoma spectabile]
RHFKTKVLPLWSPCLQEESQILPTRTTKRQVTKKTSPSQCPVSELIMRAPMSPALTRTLFFSPLKLQSCLSSTWLSLHSTVRERNQHSIVQRPGSNRAEEKEVFHFLTDILQRRFWLEISSIFGPNAR